MPPVRRWRGQLEQLREGRRAGCKTGVRGQLSCELLVAHPTGHFLGDRLFNGFACCPVGRERGDAVRLVSASPRVVGCPPRANDGSVENDGSRALRVCGREQGGDRCAVPRSDQCGSFRAHGVHDRSHIIHPFLERGRTEHRIRDAGASLIEEEDARDRGERSVVVSPALEFPAVFDVREGSRDDHEVEWARAEHLVPDVDVAAAAGVVDLRPVHPKSLPLQTGASSGICRSLTLQLVHLYAERRSPKYEKAALRWPERYLIASRSRSSAPQAGPDPTQAFTGVASRLVGSRESRRPA